MLCSICAKYWIMTIMVLPAVLCSDNICEATQKQESYVVSLTRIQMMQRIQEAEVQCTYDMLHKAPPTSDVFCNMTFHNGICWPYGEAGSIVEIPCPDYINKFYIKGKAKRICNPDGTWYINPKNNKTYANYTECLVHSEEDKQQVPVHQVHRENAHIIKVILIVGYSVSLASLLMAIIPMTAFKKLRCQRNTIHVNLFVSFILRAIICIIKDLFLVPPGPAKVEGNFIQHTVQGQAWPCKMVQTLFQYTTLANYMWILVEGVYLHTLIFFPLLYNRNFFKAYILFGWSMPLPILVTWMLVRLHYADCLCWSTLDYLWIIRGPIILVFAINAIFFVRIVRVLFSKLRDPNNEDPQRYRKLARSTLVLIPLFGVFYITFAAIPDSIDTFTAVVFMYAEIIWSSFQGLLVATLFCFMNSEVQNEIKKIWWRQSIRRQSTISSRSLRTYSTVNASTYVRERGPSEVDNDFEMNTLQTTATKLLQDYELTLKDYENNDLKLNGINSIHDATTDVNAISRS